MVTAVTDVRGVATILGEYRVQLAKIQSDLLAQAADLLESSLEAGEDAMHTRIETAVTPTGERRALYGFGSGEPGRIDTGAYYDGVEHDLEADSNTEMTGYLGWLSDKRDYFQEQEDGFVANGHEVEAVHALLDGATIAKQQFSEGLVALVEKEFGA